MLFLLCCPKTSLNQTSEIKIMNISMCVRLYPLKYGFMLASIFVVLYFHLENGMLGRKLLERDMDGYITVHVGEAHASASVHRCSVSSAIRPES